MHSGKPSPSFKKSIDGLFNVWLNLRNQGHEKPLRNAMYNILVITAIGAVLGVGLVLAPFFKPLLWAFLFGALLYPAKKSLSDGLHSWLDRVESEDKHLLFGIITLPVEQLDKLGKYLSSWLYTHVKVLSIGALSIISLRLLLMFAPKELFSKIYDIILWSHSMFGVLISILSIQLVVLAVVMYVISVYFLWTPQTSTVFLIAGQGLWIVVTGYCCSYLGAFQLPAFLGLLIYGLIGLIYNFNNAEETHIFGKYKTILEKSSYGSAPSTPIASTSQSVMSPGIMDSNKITEIKNKMQLNVPTKYENSQQQDPADESLESDLYFRILFYVCMATVLWKHSWIVFLTLIPIITHGVKYLAVSVGLVSYATSFARKHKKTAEDWLYPRQSAIFPVCLPGVLQVNGIVHKYVCSKLKTYIDDISAIVMIVFLIFFVIFVSAFSFAQIYSETIAVAQLGSNLVNRTLTHRPDLVEMLPIDMQSMDNIIDNAYKYGRSSIETYIDGIFNDSDTVQAVKLKNQILSVWDRLIQSYMDRNNHDSIVGPRVTADSLRSTIDEIVINPVTKAGLIGWVKSNLGMLLEVADSLWILLRTNINVLVSLFSSMFSVVLGGGHAVITFLFHTIIFFTTLYYLLQSSQDRYAPIAVNINSEWGSRLASALEDSISSVLVATLKLALFHGLFTWLTHTVFGAHIVYLPAVLASILAAAPFLETYWCSFPAFLDLWLSQNRFWLGVVLVLIHFIVPSNFNPIIHSEIKGGGHPYLTGLSIAGGIYLLGLEGAVLGPLLLCLLVVLFEVTMSALRETPTISPQTRQSSLDNETATPDPLRSAYRRQSAFQQIS